MTDIYRCREVYWITSLRWQSVQNCVRDSNLVIGYPRKNCALCLVKEQKVIHKNCYTNFPSNLSFLGKIEHQTERYSCLPMLSTSILAVPRSLNCTKSISDWSRGRISSSVLQLNIIDLFTSVTKIKRIYCMKYRVKPCI